LLNPGTSGCVFTQDIIGRFALATLQQSGREGIAPDRLLRCVVLKHIRLVKLANFIRSCKPAFSIAALRGFMKTRFQI
jgi:hypothetical protein